MDIAAEIMLWSLLGLVVTVGLGLALPAFFRTLYRDGADVSPDFLRGDDRRAIKSRTAQHDDAGEGRSGEISEQDVVILKQET